MPELSQMDLLLLCAGAIGAGLWLLARGGDWLVDAAVFVAGRAGVSNFLIGSTIVAFGTSAPELAVSVDAARHGHQALAAGNVIGSNIANILFILGLQVLLAGRMQIAVWAIRQDAVLMLLSAVVLTLLVWAGHMPPWAGALMLLVLLGSIWWQFNEVQRQGRTSHRSHVHAHRHQVEVELAEFASIHQAILVMLLGLGALIVGAKILVLGAVTGARIIGVSEAVIGLTIVSVGTSLPELFAGLIAARKGHGDIALGNVLGSNIFNILAIMGVTAVVVPLTLSADLLMSAVLMCVVTAAFAGLLLLRGQVTRRDAIVAVVLYAFYTLWLYAGTLG